MVEVVRCEKFRYDKSLSMPAPMKHDLHTCAAIVWDTRCNPLPILEDSPSVSIDSKLLFTDFSGHLLANPSLGIYSPSIAGESPLVCSLAYPRHFLLNHDEAGHKAYAKSTALEALGFLVPLLIDPARFMGVKVLVITDNAAAALALVRGYSAGDPWASTICRAARVVAAALGCCLQADWEPRRSSRGSRISDNLTHNLLVELDSREIDAYLQHGKVCFPLPILRWMASPQSDNKLGYKCWIWLKEEYPEVCFES